MKPSKVDCKYGAPLGRHEYGHVSYPAKLSQLYLDSGGYDSGGAYWGLGKPLYCAESDEACRFVRASNRAEAAKTLDCNAELKRPAYAYLRIDGDIVYCSSVADAKQTAAQSPELDAQIYLDDDGPHYERKNGKWKNCFKR